MAFLAVGGTPRAASVAAAGLRLAPLTSNMPALSLAFSSSASPDSCAAEPPVGGVRLQDTVNSAGARVRLDTWLTRRLQGVSRARVQASIRAGLVAVNGCAVVKASHVVRDGDFISCTISELQPLKAVAEDIPLDIVYEDDHVLVVNKPAHMVVHPAPGNSSGTLVNAILHHCKISTFTCLANEYSDTSDEEIDVCDIDQFSTDEMSPQLYEALVRPGIVHRLDKGTSGLIVVAKNEHSHARLADQFRLRTIQRVYISLTCGLPNPLSSRIEMPIARDPKNRLRMMAVPAATHRRARYAASRYKVKEVLAGGGCALVEWRLETGRTHQVPEFCRITVEDLSPKLWFQIRAHAKHASVPLLGDEVYGGTKNLALSRLRAKSPASDHANLALIISKLERPCLHALSLGFSHPHSGEFLEFSAPPPEDFSEVLDQLRRLR